MNKIDPDRPWRVADKYGPLMEDEDMDNESPPLSDKGMDLLKELFGEPLKVEEQCIRCGTFNPDLQKEQAYKKILAMESPTPPPEQESASELDVGAKEHRCEDNPPRKIRFHNGRWQIQLQYQSWFMISFCPFCGVKLE